MSSWKSLMFCALVKQEIDKVEAIFNDGNIPLENITIHYAEDCNTCVGNLEYPMNPVQQNIDFVLNELKPMIDAGRCRCLPGHTSHGLKQSVSLLHLACVYGPVSLVERLLNAGYDPEEQSLAAGFTPLHYLSQSDSIASYDVLDIADMLLTRGVSVNVRDKHRNIPLHLAIENHHSKLAMLLISSGSLIDATNDTEETPLLIAAKREEEEVLVKLCEAGANPNAKDVNVMLPLNIAIQQSNEVMIKALLDNPQIDPNERGIDRLGFRYMSPLLLATSNGYADAVELLLRHGAAVDSEDADEPPPLLPAAYANYTDIAMMLIRHSANVNRVDHGGYSALHHAAWEGHFEMCCLLLDADAHHDTPTRDKNTPLALACHGDHLETIILLLDRGCDVNNQDWDLDTPMHYCTFNGNLAAVKLLLEQGAHPDLENAFQVTPIWNAVWADALDVVQLLIQCNVRLNIASRGISDHSETGHPILIYHTPRTPLYLACTKDMLMAKTLVLAGVDLRQESWLWLGDLPKELAHNTALHRWIRCQAVNPQSLLRQTRTAIRRLLGLHPQQKVQTLPITEVMKDFLIIKSFHVDL